MLPLILRFLPPRSSLTSILEALASPSPPRGLEAPYPQPGFHEDILCG